MSINTRKILSAQNFDIETVKNGEEVLNTLANEDFDLVLMDIYMPKMDGMECARTIRQQQKKMPIIAITGNADNYSMEDFQAAGINDYLPKPLNYDHMLEMVKKYLSHAG
jgi:hypothetical protein